MSNLFSSLKDKDVTLNSIHYVHLVWHNKEGKVGSN